MYLTKNEIIVMSTLLSYMLLGGLTSIIIFLAGFIYLTFINKKMRYHMVRNDSQDALMLEGGTNQRNGQYVKFGMILILWAIIWYMGGNERQLIEVFEKDNIRYVEDIISNFLTFWVFLIQLACFVLTAGIGYKLFNTAVNSEAYSKREVMLAGSLLIELISGIYYFYHWFIIGDHSQFFDSNMSGIIIQIIVFNVIAATVLSLLVYGKKAEEAKDERDLLIEVKGYKYGFYAMSTLVAVLIGRLVTNDYFQSLWPARALNLNIVEIGNLMLLIIIVAWAIVSAAQLFFYRRGY